MNTQLNIKLLSSLATIPTKGTEKSAGFDLYAAISEPKEIAPHGMIKIPTDVAIELPPNTFGAIYPRSGIATKRGLRLSNSVAVIDEDYRGNCIIPIYNDSDQVQTIEPKERIAQLVIQPYIPAFIAMVEELSDTERGSGGFGSTGTN